MKKIFMSLLLLVAVTAVAGQVKQGIIIYERKVNMHKNIPKEDERIKNIIPEFNTSKLKLTFNEWESVASNIAEEPDITASAGEDGNNRIRIRLNQPEVETYKNYNQNKTVELRELGPRKYIIEQDLPQYKWQLKEETKSIGGYTCKKATTRNHDNKEVVAWFTESINCPSGPEAWGGLPGMILGLEMDDAHLTYNAVLIDSSTTSNQVVKIPTGGKKISEAEFERMMKESMGSEERGGRVIIRTLE